MTAETFQGKPCKQGHSGLRYVSSSGCVDCALGHTPKQPKRRRTVELIAVVVSHGDGNGGVIAAATFSTPDGFVREEFTTDETVHGLSSILREIAAWIDCNYGLEKAA